MKEYSLKSGDKIEQWTVQHHISNGCVYGVKRKNDPVEYAMKIREKFFPNNSDPRSGQKYLMNEVKKLKKINASGAHPSFQQLVDYNDDPNNLYLVMKPLMKPKRSFFRLDFEELNTIDPHAFLKLFFEAVQHARNCGIDLAHMNQNHLFVTNRGKPFFLGLSDEQPVEDIRYIWDFRLLENIIDRFKNVQIHHPQLNDSRIYSEINPYHNFNKFFIDLGWITLMRLTNANSG